MFIPRQGLLITFVRATIPQTLHAAILFSCLCFYDFPKRTAPKIHKIWHLVNLINVRRPFAKKKRQKLVSAGNVFYVILTIQYAEHGCYMHGLCFELFCDNSDSPGCPTVPAGAELSFGGAAALSSPPTTP